MRSIASPVATVLLSAATLLVLHAPVHANGPSASSHRNTLANPQLSLSQVVAQLEQAGYSQIREVEWDDGRYEVEARNRRGQRVELEVSPKSGEVLRVELQD